MIICLLSLASSHVVENLLFWDAGEMTFYNFCMCMSTEIQEQHAVIDKVGLPVMLGLNLLEYTCYALIFCEMRRYVVRSAVPNYSHDLQPDITLNTQHMLPEQGFRL